MSGRSKSRRKRLTPCGDGPRVCPETDDLAAQGNAALAAALPKSQDGAQPSLLSQVPPSKGVGPGDVTNAITAAQAGKNTGKRVQQTYRTAVRTGDAVGTGIANFVEPAKKPANRKPGEPKRGKPKKTQLQRKKAKQAAAQRAKHRPDHGNRRKMQYMDKKFAKPARQTGRRLGRGAGHGLNAWAAGDAGVQGYKNSHSKSTTGKVLEGGTAAATSLGLSYTPIGIATAMEGLLGNKPQDRNVTGVYNNVAQTAGSLTDLVMSRDASALRKQNQDNLSGKNGNLIKGFSQGGDWAGDLGGTVHNTLQEWGLGDTLSMIGGGMTTALASIPGMMVGGMKGIYDGAVGLGSAIGNNKGVQAASDQTSSWGVNTADYLRDKGVPSWMATTAGLGVTGVSQMTYGTLRGGYDLAKQGVGAVGSAVSSGWGWVKGLFGGGKKK
jgi:hypothetical protein